MRSAHLIRLLVCFVLTFVVLSSAGAQDSVSTPKIRSAQDDGLYVDPVFTPALTKDGVVYGRSVNVDGELQDLVANIYEPEGHDDPLRPVIVWAAGGGFVYNRGRDRVYWMLELVERGYVVISIEYRIRPDMPYGFGGITTALATGDASIVDEAVAAARDAQHDMQAAVRWVRANAEELRVDPKRVVAAGYSAGAIMALLTAFNADDPGESGNPGWSSHVSAAISGAGGFVSVAQGTIEPGEPPILMFHGTHDTTLPVFAALFPCTNTLAVGNVCEMHLYPGEGHGLEPCCNDELIRKSVDFLYRHVIDPQPFPLDR